MLMFNQVLSYLSLNDTKLGNESFEKLVEGLQNNLNITQLKLSKNGLIANKSICALMQLPIFDLDISKNNLNDVFLICRYIFRKWEGKKYTPES